MGWFDRTVGWFFPRILLSGTPWKSVWEAQERESFVSTARLFFPFAAVVYIAHYYFYDLPMGSEPKESWFAFRMSTAALCLITTGIYFTRYQRSTHYKWLAATVCAFFCFAQARVAVNFGEESWIFCFVLIALSAQVLREPLATSLLFATVLVLLVAPSLVEAKVAAENIVSGALVTFSMIMALRSSYRKDIKNFLLNQENLARQEQFVELNRDFTDRIRSFIPTVISNRIESFVSNNRMSVIEASIEVLRAQEKTIACLFSDIRGYTQSSKELEAYISESVIPEMRVCSNVIEHNEGIPRKIGDLVFAYFDSDTPSLNVMRALSSAVQISRTNRAMNSTLTEKSIDRYILISTGEAVVGNIGGVDSSVEITALGSPVNYLSRLDELTKSGSLSELIAYGDVVACEQTFRAIKNASLALTYDEIDLEELGIEIRDFSEARKIYVIKPSDSNEEVLRSEIFRLEEQQHNEKTPRFRRIA